MTINLKNLHVLIVEDITPMRELTTSVLKAQGIGRISYASDGEKGFDTFCHLNPDIVITDWQMPVLNGIELAKKIRTHSHSPNKMVPIIMMTGFGSASKISSARDVGITEFLIKPFSAHDISKRIMHIISSPRDFIITENFAGPDRRRKKDNPHFTGANLRTNEKGYQKKIPANHLLQAKVGLGVVDEETLQKSQSIIEKNNFNFVPIATMFLAQLRDALDIAKAEGHGNRRTIERLINPVMQIKANARIFKYGLLGDLASIMLNFLENMNEVDRDIIDIVEAHHRTLTHIISSEMQGDGGNIGKTFETELDNACKRYTNSRILMQKEKMQKLLDEKNSA